MFEIEVLLDIVQMLSPSAVQSANAVIQSASLTLAIDVCSLQTPFLTTAGSDTSENSQQILTASFVIKSIVILLMLSASILLIKHICHCIMALSIDSAHPEVHSVIWGSFHCKRQVVADSQVAFTALHREFPPQSWRKIFMTPFKYVSSRIDTAIYRPVEADIKYKSKIRAPTAGNHSYSRANRIPNRLPSGDNRYAC